MKYFWYDHLLSLSFVFSFCFDFCGFLFSSDFFSNLFVVCFLFFLFLFFFFFFFFFGLVVCFVFVFRFLLLNFFIFIFIYLFLFYFSFLICCKLCLLCFIYFPFNHLGQCQVRATEVRYFFEESWGTTYLKTTYLKTNCKSLSNTFTNYMIQWNGGSGGIWTHQVWVKVTGGSRGIYLNPCT